MVSSKPNCTLKIVEGFELSEAAINPIPGGKGVNIPS